MSIPYLAPPRGEMVPLQKQASPFPETGEDYVQRRTSWKSLQTEHTSSKTKQKRDYSASKKGRTKSEQTSISITLYQDKFQGIYAFTKRLRGGEMFRYIRTPFPATGNKKALKGPD